MIRRVVTREYIPDQTRCLDSCSMAKEMVREFIAWPQSVQSGRSISVV